MAAEAAQREVLVRPIGASLYLMPPYLLDEEQAHWLGRQLHAAFAATMEAL